MNIIHKNNIHCTDAFLAVTTVHIGQHGNVLRTHNNRIRHTIHFSHKKYHMLLYGPLENIINVIWSARISWYLYFYRSNTGMMYILYFGTLIYFPIDSTIQEVRIGPILGHIPDKFTIHSDHAMICQGTHGFWCIMDHAIGFNY